MNTCITKCDRVGTTPLEDSRRNIVHLERRFRQIRAGRKPAGASELALASRPRVPHIETRLAALPPWVLAGTAEHEAIGQNLALHFSNWARNTSFHLFELPNALSLRFGDIVALAGDFYGVPGCPISDARDPEEAFLMAFDTLASDGKAALEVPRILSVLAQEGEIIRGLLEEGMQPSQAYERLGERLDKQWNHLTGGCSPHIPAWWTPLCWGRYTWLAHTNWDHFGTHALIAFRAGLTVAMKVAVEASALATDEDRNRKLQLAYAMVAFAGHFLSDLFSAGRLRTPRKQLCIATGQGFMAPDAASFCARLMHDEDNHNGLWVSNGRGDQWIAHGGARYGDPENAANRAMLALAMQASINDVFQAFLHQRVPAHPSSLDFTPVLDFDPHDRQNHAPLFTATASSPSRTPTILVRARRHDPTVHEFRPAGAFIDEAIGEPVRIGAPPERRISSRTQSSMSSQARAGSGRSHHRVKQS